MRSGIGFALLCVAACSSTTEPANGVNLRIVNVAAAAGPVAYITFVASNESSATLYLPRCGEDISVEVERRDADAWVNASAAICPAGLRADPIRLAAGAQFTSHRSVSGMGTFRLHASTFQEDTTMAPHTLRAHGDAYSASFPVR